MVKDSSLVSHVTKYESIPDIGLGTIFVNATKNLKVYIECNC